MWPWSKPSMDQAERELVDSIKSLKSLRCVDGRVSISPSEVIDRPGYHEARVAAAAMIRRRPSQPVLQADGELPMDDLVLANLISQRVLAFRRRGLGLDEAIAALRDSLSGGVW